MRIRVTQLLGQSPRLTLRGVTEPAKINVGGTTVDRHRLRLHQQQQALDAAGPANRRGRTATELLDQTIVAAAREHRTLRTRSEEHTSELQPLMRIPYAVF